MKFSPDSAFSNIKIPTDTISIGIAKKAGFKHERTDIIRERKSRGGMILHEVVIVLKTLFGFRSFRHFPE